MVSYPSIPQFKITTNYSGTPYVFENDQFLSGKIIRRENGFDIATLFCSDYKSLNFLNKVAADEDIKIEFKDASDAAWTTVLDGVVRFITLPFNKDMGETMLLNCDGAGYGLEATKCAQEYGTDSANPTLDHIGEILTDATNGVIPKWANKILASATGSGHSYTTIVDAGTTTVPYVYFPYKPCSKCISDLIDIEQGGRGAAAGLHWIVTHDDKLLVSEIENHSAGVIAEDWTDYYGGSQAAATLKQGVDFVEHNFQRLGKEANYILYAGAFRRPGSGDFWTESNAANWDTSVINAAWQCTMSDDAAIKVMGANSLEAWCDNAGSQFDFCYPSSKDAGMDLTKIGGEHNIPTVSFYVRCDTNCDRTMGGALALPFIFLGQYTEPGGVPVLSGWQYEFGSLIPTDDKWYYFNLPIGPYWRSAGKDFDGWHVRNSDQWADVDIVHFKALSKAGQRGKMYVDALQINGTVIRGARETTIDATNPLKMKVVVDDVGKDDTLVDADDSGAIGQLAYAELLRSQSTPYVGWVTTPLIKDLLPGQLLYINAKKKSDGNYQVQADMRATKVTHSFGSQGWFTRTELTSDLKNGNTRLSYSDLNSLLKAERPEYQDRQASSIKSRLIDITQSRLVKSY